MKRFIRVFEKLQYKKRLFFEFQWWPSRLEGLLGLLNHVAKEPGALLAGFEAGAGTGTAPDDATDHGSGGQDDAPGRSSGSSPGCASSDGTNLRSISSQSIQNLQCVGHQLFVLWTDIFA